MSEPARPRTRELEIMRALFDRHLLERAINLADVRWAGSGKMVRLAYEWSNLSPADRRAQLEEIGPEQLAQFRAFAELNPELAQVLDTLEARGVLAPSEPVSSEDEPAPDDTVVADVEPESLESIEPEIEPEFEPEPEPEPVMAAPVEQSEPPEPAAVFEPSVDIEWADAGGAGWDPAEFEAIAAQALEDIDATREEFVASEQARRAEAVATAEEVLERVRARLDRTARQVTSNPPGASTARLPAMVTSPPATRTPEAQAADERRFTPPPDYWLQRLKNEQVVVVDETAAAPTDDELIALANELGIGFAEYVIAPGATRDLFGKLRRNGGKIDVEVGPLTASLANASLVVARGRLYPKLLEGVARGMVDIPGTRASVAVDPASRLLVIPWI